MSTLMVVDVGNSRLKWGRCDNQRIIEAVSLPLDDANVWQSQVQTWSLASAQWAVAGVNPQRMERFLDWLAVRGESVEVLDSYQKLSMRIAVERPEEVGIDRLLNAVAAARRERGPVPALIVDAGSAVTVDLLDEKNIFRGGAIFPGPRLMAQALNTYTAKLPLVELTQPPPPLPGTNTSSAIAGGVYAAAVGGIHHAVRTMGMGRSGEQRAESKEPEAALRSPLSTPGVTPVYLTGGDAAWLAPGLEAAGIRVELWPFMTLEGIRLACRHS